MRSGGKAAMRRITILQLCGSFVLPSSWWIKALLVGGVNVEFRMGGGLLYRDARTRYLLLYWMAGTLFDWSAF